MRTVVINGILGGLVGYTVSELGGTVYTLEFWIILLAMAGIIINTGVK